MPIVIAIVILLFSHLTVDRDFPDNVKTVSYSVFIGLAILYVVTQLIF